VSGVTEVKPEYEFLWAGAAKGSLKSRARKPAPRSQMAKNRRSMLTRTSATGFICLCGAFGTPTASAEPGNPAVNCDSSQVGGVDQDVCVGKPGAVAGVEIPDLYPGVVPRLRFGLGIGG
jgi:hypothetical protein